MRAMRGRFGNLESFVSLSCFRNCVTEVTALTEAFSPHNILLVTKPVSVISVISVTQLVLRRDGH
jgi:hypothetical protein